MIRVASDGTVFWLRLNTARNAVGSNSDSKTWNPFFSLTRRNESWSTEARRGSANNG